MGSTYVLFIQLTQNLSLRVGKLGPTFFRRGTYVYVGSARRCLESRLRRHKRSHKKPFWHIDYLLATKGGTISEIWTTEKALECCAAKTFQKSHEAQIVKRGFGASDCCCPTRLFYIKQRVAIRAMVWRMGFRKRDSQAVRS